MRPFSFTEAAERELTAAAGWFEEHSGIGGARFLAIMHRTVEAICESPFAAPPWSYAPRFRARTVQGLRYRVIYQILDPSIRIVALIHTSRDPRDWAFRLG